jgi:ribosomal protein L28
VRHDSEHQTTITELEVVTNLAKNITKTLVGNQKWHAMALSRTACQPHHILEAAWERERLQKVSLKVAARGWRQDQLELQVSVSACAC